MHDRRNLRGFLSQDRAKSRTLATCDDAVVETGPDCPEEKYKRFMRQGDERHGALAGLRMLRRQHDPHRLLDERTVLFNFRLFQQYRSKSEKLSASKCFPLCPLEPDIAEYGLHFRLCQKGTSSFRRCSPPVCTRQHIPVRALRRLRLRLNHSLIMRWRARKPRPSIGLDVANE
jgi:hypothetical protein